MPRKPTKKRRSRTPVTDLLLDGEPAIDFDDAALNEKYLDTLLPTPQTRGARADHFAVFCNGSQVGELVLDKTLTTKALERSFLIEQGGVIARLYAKVAAALREDLNNRARLVLQQETIEGLFSRVLGQIFRLFRVSGG